MKLYYFYTLKALWDKIKMYYGVSRVKKQLSGKRSTESCLIGILLHINLMVLEIKHYRSINT